MNIIWQKVTVGRGRPSYKVNYEGFNAEITNRGSCFCITINENSIAAGNGFFNPPVAKVGLIRETRYYSSVTSCKNYFRKFLKRWGVL